LIIGASIILTLILIINTLISGYLLRQNTIEDRTDQVASLTLIMAEHASQIIFSANTVLNSIDDVIKVAKIHDEKSFRDFASSKKYLNYWKIKQNQIQY
jgi:hypothetical protein